MKGIEKQFLNIIKELDEADRDSLAFKLGISPEYVTQICSVLVKDGYIEERPGSKFRLTLKAKKVISPVKASGGPIPILKGAR